jgi:hypothetical protein
MEYYAGIDVSLESASLCVVDATGRIVREAKVASESEILIGWFRGLGLGDSDRAGGRTAVAAVICGHAGCSADRRIARAPACARCIQGDADQDRSQGRAASPS